MVRNAFSTDPMLRTGTVQSDDARAPAIRAALSRIAPAADVIELEEAVLSLVWMADRAARIPSKERVRAQVIRLQKAMEEMEAAAIGLSAEAILALDAETRERLGNVALRLVAASNHVRRWGAPADPSTFAMQARSRRRKPQARMVAEEAAEWFHRLTGRRPTISTAVGYGHKAGGPFIDLLAELFAALEVNASPESQARAVV